MLSRVRVHAGTKPYPGLGRGSAVRLSKRPGAVLPCPATLGMESNPQNVGQPQVLPDPKFTPDEAVIVQLNAIRDNCNPWYNHGILTMYEWGEDVGGMERSRYIEGQPRDLYHFDHFMGLFATRFGTLVDHDSFEIESSNSPAPGFHEVFVNVQCDADTAMKLMFIMKMKEIGKNKGCWMTLCLKKV